MTLLGADWQVRNKIDGSDTIGNDDCTTFDSLPIL